MSRKSNFYCSLRKGKKRIKRLKIYKRDKIFDMFMNDSINVKTMYKMYNEKEDRIIKIKKHRRKYKYIRRIK